MIYAQPKPQKTPKQKRVKSIKTRVVRSLPALKKRTQTIVNAYIRLRDTGYPCMACKKYCSPGQAGHYISQGQHGALRYNLDNIWKCCVACNLFKHGNLIEYRIHLVEKIGEKRVKYLEDHRHDTKKWTREELEDMQKILHEQLKEISGLED
ncbi:MAG: recombination protein NinG [Patescibacteria group bacterium]